MPVVLRVEELRLLLQRVIDRFSGKGVDLRGCGFLGFLGSLHIWERDFPCMSSDTYSKICLFPGTERSFRATFS